MLKEPIHQSAKDIRHKPKEGQRPNRINPYGGKQPTEADRGMAPSRVPAETGVRRTIKKSGFKKALPYLIAGGGTAIGGIGFLSIF